MSVVLAARNRKYVCCLTTVLARFCRPVRECTAIARHKQTIQEACRQLVQPLGLRDFKLCRIRRTDVAVTEHVKLQGRCNWPT